MSKETHIEKMQEQGFTEYEASEIYNNAERILEIGKFKSIRSAISHVIQILKTR